MTFQVTVSGQGQSSQDLRRAGVWPLRAKSIGKSVAISMLTFMFILWLLLFYHLTQRTRSTFLTSWLGIQSQNVPYNVMANGLHVWSIANPRAVKVVANKPIDPVLVMTYARLKASSNNHFSLHRITTSLITANLKIGLKWVAAQDCAT